MRHYLYLFLLFIGLSISLTSCHGVMPDAEIEANEMHDAVVKEIATDLVNDRLRIKSY